MQIEKREPNLLVLGAEPLGARVAKLVSGLVLIAAGVTELAMVALGIREKIEPGALSSFLIQAALVGSGVALIALGVVEAVNVLPFRREIAGRPPSTWRSSPVRKLLDEAQKLPKQDRALVRAELEQLDHEAPEDEVEDAWDEEIARRLQSIKDGTAVLHDHDDVMRELEEIVKR